MQTLIAPVPIDLPHVGGRRAGRRLAQTLALAARRITPAASRRATRRPGADAVLARACRELFEELGTTYVKFGQFIASAPGIVGEAMASEFRGCLDSGPAVPFAAVRRIVERELGMPLASAFARFDEAPIAAASIAVVHRARMHDGTEVAVKILRPGIERAVATDLAIMEPFARFLAGRGVDQAYNIVGLVISLRSQIAEELDLRNEARTMDVFRELFAQFGLDRLIVPHVYPELSARRVLTMEYIDGKSIDDLAGVAELGVEPRPLVRDLLRAWVLSGLRFAAFHADIHAGNLLLMGDGRLAMLDWGIIARLDGDTERLFRRLTEVALGREEAWPDIISSWIGVEGAGLYALGLNDAQIGHFVRASLEPVLTLPLAEVSMAALLMGADEVVRVATGKPAPPRSVRQRIRSMRAAARAYREASAAGAFETPTLRMSFLATKQLVYLERYGRMYMPDESLLGDHEFLRRALDAPVIGSPDRDGGQRIDDWQEAATLSRARDT